MFSLPNRTVLARFFLAATFLLLPLGAASGDDHLPPGGKMLWARLKTQSLSWQRHAQSDPYLLHFIRTTAKLNIDPVWHAADVEKLDQMCTYPFIFSEGLHHVTDAPGLQNLREYFQRGGFIFIDSCINASVNPDPDDFLQAQISTLQSILPDAHVERLPDDHVIYRNCFEMKDGLPHTYMNNVFDENWHKHGLYAVHSGGQLISIISLSGLQCGWDRMNPDPEHVTNCMKMMVNIYVYALTH